MKSPLKLIAGIRFQLDQLNASNAHHEFEHLCRHLGRATITPEILPATGPVSAGGDQARDFETFTTFLSRTSEGSRLFFGSGESKPLVFACSLQRTSIERKIRSDIQDIVEAGKPYIIYFFSNQNVAVALRHRVQAWSMETYGVRLEILDAQAIAEQLALPKLFWIAEEYLKIPSELFPRMDGDHTDPYEKIRNKWLEGDLQPHSHSDFVEVKLGLRRATFNEQRKPDLKRWIALMDQLVAGQPNAELKRRATYEICVATLRGMNNLDSRRELVEAYFAEWGQPTDSNLLKDASILLSYCTSASLRNCFQIDSEVLHRWSAQLVCAVDREITKSKEKPNTTAALLETRAHLSQLAYVRGLSPSSDLDETFKWWSRLATAAKAAPLYPIEDFADVLTHLAVYLSDDARYATLVGRVEKILQERSKGYVVAEKSRDRAIELLRAEKILAGIDQLHRARVRWFTGDTIKGTFLALLTLSDAYVKLGLVYAAKYHALGAVFIAAKSTDDEIRRYLADAFHAYGLVQYAAGESMSFGETFPLFLLAHYSHVANPDEWINHESVQAGLMHYLISKSWARALGGEELGNAFEEPLKALQMPEEVRAEILSAPLPLEAYEQMSAAEIGKLASSEIWGAPFSDCGAMRAYRWRALGIFWDVSCANDINDLPFVEQFVAVLQITIADLARHELCLLPTAVDLKVSVSDIDEPVISSVPNNSRVVFSVTLRRRKGGDAVDLSSAASEVLAVASTLFIACSALPAEQVIKVLTTALKSELPARTFLVRPYWELFLELTPVETFIERYSQVLTTEVGDSFELRQHVELSWPDGPGPGYSKRRAEEFLRNRYRRAILPIRRSLLRYRMSPRFASLISELRSEGMLDWQILNMIANVVVDFRVKAEIGIFDPFEYKQLTMALINKEEDETDIQMPEETLYGEDFLAQKKIAIAANANTWGLVVRQATPNFDALKKLLDVRFFQSTDDVPHDDLFSPLN